MGEICLALPIVKDLLLLSELLNTEQKDSTVGGDSVYQGHMIEILEITRTENL